MPRYLEVFRVVMRLRYLHIDSNNLTGYVDGLMRLLIKITSKQSSSPNIRLKTNVKRKSAHEETLVFTAMENAATQNVTFHPLTYLTIWPLWKSTGMAKTLIIRSWEQGGFQK